MLVEDAAFFFFKIMMTLFRYTQLTQTRDAVAENAI